MKNKILVFLLAATPFVASTVLTTNVYASIINTEAYISNFTLSFSSTNANDIYFFPDSRNSFSQARTGNLFDITATTIPADSDYLIPGWGTTSVSQSVGSATNGSQSSASTTATSINSFASAYATEGAYSSDGYGAHWRNFYTYNTVTVTAEFDYSLIMNTDLDNFYQINWLAIPQVEARFYQGDGSSWGTPDSSILRTLPSDPFSGHITLTYTYKAGAKNYGRFEILAYSRAAIEQTPVPLPGAVWLFASGILSLITVIRKTTK